MFPASKHEALLRQLETEHAIQQLTFTAYELWLPFAEANLFPSLTAAAAPDPNGMSRAARWWRYILDNLILPGIGYIWGYETIRGYRALGGRNPQLISNPAPPANQADPAPPANQADPAEQPAAEPEQDSGLAPASNTSPEPPPTATAHERSHGAQDHTPAQLHATARNITATSLGTEPDTLTSLDDRLARVPTIRELQSQYLQQVHNRMVNTPETIFRDITSQLDEGLAAGEHPDVMAGRVQQYLNPETGDWPGRAVTVARTESAGAMSSATMNAAQLRNTELDEDLQQVWLATMDEVTRAPHFAADGQRVALGSSFKVGTAHLKFPGDPSGPPELTINCRCRLAVLAADEPLPIERGAARAAEVARRAADGVIRARDSDDGTGSVAAAAILKKYHGTPYVFGKKDIYMTSSVLAGTAATEESAEEFRSFTSVLAVIGKPTDDGRIFASDIDFRFRPFPLPLMWQRQSNIGHFESFTVGVIESAQISGDQIIGEGYLLNTAEAGEAAEQITHSVSAPSVDLGDVTWVLTDADGKEISEEDWWDDPDMEVTQKVTSAKMLGATLVSTPAFEDTSITLGDMVSRALTAAAAVQQMAFTEPQYPAEFFTDPGFTAPTLPSITAEGRITGHLAAFNTCHIGIQDRCVMAPRSTTSYAHFHTAPAVLTESGERVKVGRLTVGGGHAAPHLRMGPAAAHYDDAGTCFALVHVGEDEHGIWFSGVPAPGATPEQISRGLSAPLSGDWRDAGGHLELVAALAVNTPGFPLIASGATNENQDTLSLIASLGPCRPDKDTAAAEDMYAKIAVAAVREWRAGEHRTIQAQSILAAEQRRADALALIQEA